MKQDQGYGGFAGKSIVEMLWDRLEDTYTTLLDENKLTPEYKRLQGHCAGLAEAIATMRNPYEPDAQEIRIELKERMTEDD